MRSLRIRPIVLLAATVAATAGAVFHGAGCAQQATTVPVRSLERSGKASFVCLGPTGVGQTPEFHPLTDCTTQQFTDINEYLYADDAGDIDAGSGLLPHLYALVTQTTRGEVAVVDTSSVTNNVLDENPVEPGANFLPVGAQPTSIVSTPGGMATFVGVGEIGRAGLFALPSERIRPGNTVPDAGLGGAGGEPSFHEAIPQLTSWPACALPAAPGDMILVNDPAVGGLERATCDDPYAATASDTLSAEKQGRQKLVMTIPSLGGIAILDAQTLLNRPAGSFDPCDVERWVPLEVDLTGFAPTPTPPPTGPSCVYPTQPEPALAPPYQPHPGGLSYADGTLYIADTAAPVIHVVEMSTPCDPIERAPLVPFSAESPKRVVTTSRVAVAPAPTPDFRRYLYATDIDDGSIMMFDVGPNSTTRRPLQRKNAELDPVEPRDRVKFAAPAADLLVVQRDAPEINPATGISVDGVRCNPDPAVPICTTTSKTCDISANYVTNRGTYQTGAGPLKLRGTFAFAALTNGRVAVIDVDDFDAPCRGPDVATTLAGCAKDGNSGTPLNTSWESSCNVVQPNAPRAANYEVVDPNAGSHAPGITAFPQLYDPNGAQIPLDPSAPVMLAPLPTDPNLPSDPNLSTSSAKEIAGYSLWVGGNQVGLVGATAPDSTTKVPAQHTLAMNLEDPRAQLVDQDWSVIFEGSIPAFIDRLADLRTDKSLGAKGGVYDPDAHFCDAGVLGEDAMQLIYGDALKSAYGPIGDVAKARFADYVQITSDLPNELDQIYWKSLESDPVCQYDDPANPGKKATVDYQYCQQHFGTPDAPLDGRDLRIVEAYQDHVELAPRPGAQDMALPTAGLADLHLKCCFPDAVSFTVRTGNQWLVLAAQSGMLHHVVADPATGACRNSCDPVLQRKNGRAFAAPAGATLPDDKSPLMFRNPMFRFVLQAGTGSVLRDSIFRFTTQGSFVPLQVTLTADSTTLVQPQAMTFLPATGELAVTDGQFNGLMFVSLSSVALSRTFY